MQSPHGRRIHAEVNVGSACALPDQEIIVNVGVGSEFSLRLGNFRGHRRIIIRRPSLGKLKTALWRRGDKQWILRQPSCCGRSSSPLASTMASQSATLPAATLSQRVSFCLCRHDPHPRTLFFAFAAESLRSPQPRSRPLSTSWSVVETTALFSPENPARSGGRERRARLAREIGQSRPLRVWAAALIQIP